MTTAKLNINVHEDGRATIVSNDGTHGPHDESNPDTGETSQFALDLAVQLEKLGLETTVSRLD